MKNASVILLGVLQFCLITTVLADPTLPADYQAEGKQVDVMPLKVTMIVGRDNRYVALVAGQNVKVGSVIRGFTVTRITKNSVVLKAPDDQQSLVLTLTQKVKGKHGR